MKNKIINIEAVYETTLSWSLESIAEKEGFKVEDIDEIEIGKYTTLYISLKNGTSFNIDADINGHETDYKYPKEEFYFDKDWNIVEEEWVKNIYMLINMW